MKMLDKIRRAIVFISFRLSSGTAFGSESNTSNRPDNRSGGGLTRRDLLLESFYLPTAFSLTINLASLDSRQAMEFAFPPGKTARGDDSCDGRKAIGRSFFMLDYFLVMVGGALGTGARFWLSGFVAQRAGEFFPLGTLVVNVSGSFVLGFLAGLADPLGPFLIGPRIRQFLMIGLCGGYTTFSSFSLQTLDLAQAGDWLKAGANILLSVGCCLAAVWLGRILALWILPR
jgi:fluoride exporter